MKSHLSKAALLIALSVVNIAHADEGRLGEQTYKRLVAFAKSDEGAQRLSALTDPSISVDWSNATSMRFDGHLRQIKSRAGFAAHGSTAPAASPHQLFLIRKLTGELFILPIPNVIEPRSPYAGLADRLNVKLRFDVEVASVLVDGFEYRYCRFTRSPSEILLDRVLKIAMVAMLFSIMIGMGLTLTLRDFALVFSRPTGIAVGQVLQFGVMPLLAVAVGHLLGYYDQYPFIFVGLVLISVTPGGVVSNLMTFYAKGDVALSISLTSISTVLSLLFTPLLLGLYCANVPDVAIPIKLVAGTILFMVLLPLIIGMLMRHKWPGFARRATTFFSIFGIVALLFILVSGVLGNLHNFAATDRYGFSFYATLFGLTAAGMLLGGAVPKLFNVDNYQVRAIALETGLRNSVLAMSLAILIQDPMGDFYGSIFVTAAAYGLWMFLAAALTIALAKRFLPVENSQEGERSVF